MALGDDQLAPVIDVGGIEGKGSAGYSGNCSEAALQLMVESIELGLAISGRRAVHHDAEAVFGFEAENLMLQIAQASGEQACAGEQHDGKRSLHNHQNF